LKNDCLINEINEFIYVPIFNLLTNIWVYNNILLLFICLGIIVYYKYTINLYINNFHLIVMGHNYYNILWTVLDYLFFYQFNSQTIKLYKINIILIIGNIVIYIIFKMYKIFYCY